MPNPLGWLDAAIADIDARNLRRALAERSSAQRGDQIIIHGQPLVNFGSNDYLGLASDPAIVEAVRTAVREFGWGSGASPLVSGRSSLHAQLERELADFEGTEAALLFPTGYAANVGAITALVGKGDAIYSDEMNHASIIDGCRLSGAAIHVYRWPDKMQKLTSFLGKSAAFRRRLIVTESLFSMHGTEVALPRLAQLAQDYDAMLVVDEAHATGVWGKHGRGLCELLCAEEGVHVRVATLGKALGSHGGFVAGPRNLIDWLSNRARPYGLSTAAPAAAAAAALAALHIVRTEPQRRERLQQLSVKLHAGLVGCGITFSGSFQIVAVILSDPQRAMNAAIDLRRRGFFVPAIRPPSVPDGQSLLRISLTCLHTEQQVDDLVAALRDVIK